MNEPNSISTTAALEPHAPWRLLDRLGQRLFHSEMSRLTRGRLTISDGSECRVFGSDVPELNATVNVTDPRFYGAVAFGGTVGAAESYIRGYWSSNDLTRVVRLLLRNRDVLD
ncbi:MAG: SAM-dependent methyltransferase, partial [Gammaproteobacteria bacterium]|nr:SAM-dependent methyltransferase [Gammaproteobacteria bacterium]